MEKMLNNLNQLIGKEVMKDGKLISQNDIHKQVGYKEEKNTLLDSDIAFMTRFNGVSHYIYEKFKAKENSFSMSINEMLKNDNFLKNEIKWLNKNFDAKRVVTEKSGNYIRAYYGMKSKIDDNTMFLRLCQVSCGNVKLAPNSKNEGFLIWSVQGFITCNGKTPLCATYCYNSSRQDDNNLFQKIDNLIFSFLKEEYFTDVVNQLLVKSGYSKTYVRIHEDGDFYDSKYFKKWLNVANKNTGIVFMAYTKEPTLLKKVNDINATENMILRFSLMADTDKKIVDYVFKNEVLNYIAIGDGKVNNKQLNELFDSIKPVSRCVDTCKTCKKCYGKNQISLITKLRTPSTRK